MEYRKIILLALKQGQEPESIAKKLAEVEPESYTHKSAHEAVMDVVFRQSVVDV